MAGKQVLAGPGYMLQMSGAFKMFSRSSSKKRSLQLIPGGGLFPGSELFLSYEVLSDCHSPPCLSKLLKFRALCSNCPATFSSISSTRLDMCPHSFLESFRSCPSSLDIVTMLVVEKNCHTHF